MPKVTVWLTSYNHGELLKESIESVLNQSYEDYELYIVDDCSTDDSRAIAEIYAEKDKRIKTIFHEKNIGESNLKGEIDGLRGEYIAILHGDDKWEKTKLEKQVEYLENHVETEACFTAVQVIDENGNNYNGEHAYKSVFQEENRSRFQWLRYFFDNGNCLCHPSLLIRKQAYSKYNLLSEGLNSLPDFDKWIKICLNRDIYIVPEKLTYFRVHESENNASGDTAEKQNRMFSEEYLVYQNYFSITDKNELIQIFPESKKYIIDGECIVPFALAKMFLEGNRGSKKLLGINKIYELCQDKEVWKKIKDLYGYGTKEFNLDKQKSDIFGMIPNDRFLNSSLYINYGSGYSEENVIKYIYYIPATGVVKMHFKIEKDIQKIQSLRFDFDEGRFRKCKIVEAQWENGEKVNLIPVNGIVKAEYVYFYTADPQYEVKLEGKDFYVNLRVESIGENEIESYIQNLKYEAEENLNREKKEKERIIREKRNIENLLNEYRKHISIKALYKILRKMNRNGK